MLEYIDKRNGTKIAYSTKQSLKPLKKYSGIILNLISNKSQIHQYI